MTRLKFTYLQSTALSLASIFTWAKRLCDDLNKWSDEVASATLASAPPGARLLWYDQDPPTGWLKADGQSVSVAAYPNLFAVIGYDHGGAGANFNVIDDLTANGLYTIIKY